jgi:hypothetical protein
MANKPGNTTRQIKALAVKKTGGLLEEYKFNVESPKV